jgi:integrase
LFFTKNVYQIKLFLIHLDIEWQSQIKLPNDPEYIPKLVTLDDIRKTLTYFDGHQYYSQIKAMILLGATLGMRKEELYQLQP